MKKVYFAAPLFSESEQLYNNYVVSEIRDTMDNIGYEIEVYLPQENGIINDKSQYADSIMIANGDNKHLEESDVLIALLDGQVIDSGVAAEIGYFYAMNKPIIGLYTDSRQGTFGNQEKIKALDEVAESQFSYINLYVVGLVKNRGKIVKTLDELLLELENVVKELNAS